MSFREEDKTIDGVTFKVNTLPYGDAIKVWAKAKELFMLKMGAAEENGEFSPLCASVFMDVDTDNLEFVIDKLAEKTRVKEGEGSFLPLNQQKEIVFAGRIELMFKWLDFALELNFANFLGGLKRQLESQQNNPEAQKSLKGLIG